MNEVCIFGLSMHDKQILMLTCFMIISYVYLNTFRFFSRYVWASPRNAHLPVPAGLCLFQMDLGPVPDTDHVKM